MIPLQIQITQKRHEPLQIQITQKRHEPLQIQIIQKRHDPPTNTNNTWDSKIMNMNYM
jgi:hypothetical protein